MSGVHVYSTWGWECDDCQDWDYAYDTRAEAAAAGARHVARVHTSEAAS